MAMGGVVLLGDLTILTVTNITSFFFLFFFNDTATTEIYTLSLHDALPISINTMLYSEEIHHHQFTVLF